MTTTPVFGIRGPDGSTKAKDLPAALAQQNLDIEAALLLAQVPPSVPANIYVAPSAAARDLAFGVPASTTARRALQNSGALCIRTDLGYTERYFDLYNAVSNPRGARTAGWYPDAGEIALKAAYVDAANVASGVAIKFPSIPEDTHAGWSAATGAYTVQVPGRYLLSTAFKQSTAVSFAVKLRKNGAVIAVSGNAAAAAWSQASIAHYEKCVPGDTIDVISNAAFTAAPDAPGINSFLEIVRL